METNPPQILQKERTPRHRLLFSGECSSSRGFFWNLGACTQAPKLRASGGVVPPVPSPPRALEPPRFPSHGLCGPSVCLPASMMLGSPSPPMGALTAPLSCPKPSEASPILVTSTVVPTLQWDSGPLGLLLCPRPFPGPLTFSGWGLRGPGRGSRVWCPRLAQRSRGL